MGTEVAEKKQTLPTAGAELDALMEQDAKISTFEGLVRAYVHGEADRKTKSFICGFLLRACGNSIFKCPVSSHY